LSASDSLPSLSPLEKIRNLVKAGKWSLDPHCEKQMPDRKITLPDIQYVLEVSGSHEKAYDQCVHGEIRYAIRGFVNDNAQNRVELRLPVVIEDSEAIVITAINLTTSPDRNPRKPRSE
jgi:hypothetical protein